MQIPRFTSSKPSEFAFASDEKSIRRPTTSFARRCRKNVRKGFQASSEGSQMLCLMTVAAGLTVNRNVNESAFPFHMDQPTRLISFLVMRLTLHLTHLRALE